MYYAILVLLICPVAPVNITSPPASGKLITLSAVGSVIDMLVSFASSVAPSKISNLFGANLIDEPKDVSPDKVLISPLVPPYSVPFTVNLFVPPTDKLSLIVTVFELED